MCVVNSSGSHAPPGRRGPTLPRWGCHHAVMCAAPIKSTYASEGERVRTSDPENHRIADGWRRATDSSTEVHSKAKGVLQGQSINLLYYCCTVLVEYWGRRIVGVQKHFYNKNVEPSGNLHSAMLRNATETRCRSRAFRQLRPFPIHYLGQPEANHQATNKGVCLSTLPDTPPTIL